MGSRNYRNNNVINQTQDNNIKSLVQKHQSVVSLGKYQQQNFAMQLSEPFSSITLESIFDPNILKVAPQTAMFDLIVLMQESHNITELKQLNTVSCIVSEAGQLLGLLAVEDLIRVAIKSSSLATLTVADVMKRQLTTLNVADFQDVFTILNLFNDHKIRHLPILDVDGYMRGIVTVESLCQGLMTLDFWQDKSVAEVMEEAIQVPSTALIKDIIPLLVDDFNNVVITELRPNQTQQFCSITAQDILSFLGFKDDFLTLTVETVMKQLICISPESSVYMADQRMQQSSVRQLLVRGSEGILGVITQNSILRSLDSRAMYWAIFALQKQVEQLKDEKLQLLQKSDKILEKEVLEQTTKLQEQAVALQQNQIELEQRNSIEEELRQLNEELENRVQDRTAQLMSLNEELVSEFAERVLTESALRDSEARFRAAAEGSLDAFFILQSLRDEKGRIIDFTCTDLNSNGEKMIALSKEEVIGKRGGELFPLSQALSFFKKFVQVVETGVVLEEEFSVSLPNITASWLHYQVVPLSDGIAITARDITQRKQAREALQKSEATNRALLNAIPDLMFRLQEDGTYLDIKVAKDDELLLFSEQILGNKITDTLPSYFAQQLMFYLKKALKTDEIQIFEIELTVTNETRNYEFRLAASRANEVLCIVRNITDRKQAEAVLRKTEERYRSIFENSVKGLFQTTPKGRYLSANAAMARIYGFNSPEELIASLTDINQHFYVDTNRQTKFLELMATEDRVSHFESQVYRQDGKIIWISENVHVVRDSQGEPLYYEGSVVDITERRVWEEALRYQQECTEELLLNILPEPIAERLKFWESTIADSFAAVTVMFADLVNFTEFSAEMPPPKLVALLNKIFSKFDQLAQKHGLEKIKTIGDAYMVVGGLPTPREDHAEAIAQMALEMQQEITKFKQDNGEAFTLRIGIHTGPVVAGVIGMKKFAYDLWGNTVNVASRMESQGVAGKIQVTSEIYEQLQDKYVFEKRGLIAVKGKGEMITYWLKGNKVCHLRPLHS
ncbi:MAG: adenylate/guanylate cyclase domain-containing protein [Coleofasciculaceae cyanobacterium]